MMRLRRANERGVTKIAWLDSRHSFSFGQYFDPSNVGFRSLRVLNEDRVEPTHGFPAHAHRDMEILSYVISGAVEHKDSIGTGSLIKPGDMQRMSAGTGVQHSEVNPSESETAHFLQIWIVPARTGLPPSYEQKTFPSELRHNRLLCLASGNGTEGAIAVHQDVEVFGSILETGRTLRYQTEEQRGVWVQVVRGRLRVNDVDLHRGDGAAFEDETDFVVTALEETEFLLFDLE